MNGGTGTAMEKLGLGSEVRELKFGQSFTGKGGDSFHTVRYDFKPASVDLTKMATLDVGTNNQVTISIPHSDGASTNVFKGARKPYAKECVLIVDHVTGEVTLEKLHSTIQVKKTRPERPEGAPRGGQKPPPPGASELKKPLPPTSLSISHGSTDRSTNKSSKDNKIKKLMPFGGASNSPNTNSAPHRGSNSPMTSVPPKHSPLGPSPGHLSPAGNINTHSSSSTAAFDNLSKKHQKPQPPLQASAMPSLPCIEDLLSFGEPTPPAPTPAPAPSYANVPKPLPPPAPPVPVHQNRNNNSHTQSQNPTRLQPPPPAPTRSKSPVVTPPAPAAPSATAVLSDSSSGEDSSSSSSSEASDDESSDGDMEVVPDEQRVISPPAPSMPMFDMLATVPMTPAARPVMTKPKPPPTTSHLLSEDLQLSESGSESDSD